jgi:hypothetical protein
MIGGCLSHMAVAARRSGTLTLLEQGVEGIMAEIIGVLKELGELA